MDISECYRPSIADMCVGGRRWNDKENRFRFTMPGVGLLGKQKPIEARARQQAPGSKPLTAEQERRIAEKFELPLCAEERSVEGVAYCKPKEQGL